MSHKSREWTLEGFVQHFDFVHKKMLDHKFVWMLGAGASRASGIPLGSELVDRWLSELHVRELLVREDGGKPALADWATPEQLGIPGFKYEDRASHYPRIYERRFRDYPDEGYAYLESVMADADPSPGYSILAAALAGAPSGPPRHNAVVTTNFDNLVADALSIYTDTFPFVCGHESLTPFVKVHMRRPLVCKIHRDLLLAPQNDPRSLRRLHDAWGVALRALFEHYTPLFIGYGGNDDTLMDLLESLQPGDIKGQLIWCYFEKSHPSERIKNLVTDLKGILVPVPDFDLLMVLLGEKMGIRLMDEEITRRASLRMERYRHRIQQLDTVAHPEVTKALEETLRRSGGWWIWEQKARHEVDPERREIVYRQGIEQFPRCPELYGNFANFMTDVRRKHDEAEQSYRKAIELNSQNALIVCNYAIFLTEVRRNHDEAESFFRKAMEIDAKYAINLGSYAIFMARVRKDYNQAEQLYLSAIEIDPNNARIVRRLADFMIDVRGNHDEAERLYRRALQLDPKNANIIAGFANFMWRVRRNYDEAERLYQQSLKLDSKNVTLIGNFASFMTYARGNHDVAERFFRRSLELDSTNATNLGRYASFMTNARGDHVEAERLYRKALELDPESANNTGNYAAFLLSRGKLVESESMLKRARMLDGGTTDQLSAEISLHTAILASARGQDNVEQLTELQDLLKKGFSRASWNFDRVLAYAKKFIRPDVYRLYAAIAEAILDATKAPTALALLAQHASKAKKPRRRKAGRKKVRK